MAVTIETLTQSIADNDFSACASVISLLDDADFTNAQKAAKLIADACRAEPVRAPFGDAGALQRLDALMRRASTSPPTQLQVARAITNLCFDNEENRDRILQCGLDWIPGLLDNGDVDLKRTVACCVANMASCSTQLQTALGQSVSVIPHLTSLLPHFGDGLAGMATHALFNLSDLLENTETMVAGGVIPLLLNMLTLSNGCSFDSMKEALELLTHFAKTSSTYRAKIVEAGAIQSLLKYIITEADELENDSDEDDDKWLPYDEEGSPFVLAGELLVMFATEKELRHFYEPVALQCMSHIGSTLAGTVVRQFPTPKPGAKIHICKMDSLVAKAVGIASSDPTVTSKLYPIMGELVDYLKIALDVSDRDIPFSIVTVFQSISVEDDRAVAMLQQGIAELLVGIINSNITNQPLLLRSLHTLHNLAVVQQKQGSIICPNLLPALCSVLGETSSPPILFSTIGVMRVLLSSPKTALQMCLDIIATTGAIGSLICLSRGERGVVEPEDPSEAKDFRVKFEACRILVRLLHITVGEASCAPQVEQLFASEALGAALFLSVSEYNVLVIEAGTLLAAIARSPYCKYLSAHAPQVVEALVRTSRLLPPSNDAFQALKALISLNSSEWQPLIVSVLGQGKEADLELKSLLGL